MFQQPAVGLCSQTRCKPHSERSTGNWEARGIASGCRDEVLGAEDPSPAQASLCQGSLQRLLVDMAVLRGSAGRDGQWLRERLSQESCVRDG